MKNCFKLKKEKAYDNLNYQMCILSAIAIIFVMIGHLNFGLENYDSAPLGSFYGWFPYYSFHLPVFLFISGYFFKDIKKESAAGFVKKKVIGFLLPYYIINGLFLLLNTWLQTSGFHYGTTFSLKAWLIEPWTKIYTITYSLPSWYLIALFIAEVYFVIIRGLAGLLVKKETGKEITILAVSAVLGAAAVYVANTCAVSETAVVYLRSLVMLFFMEIGVLYRKHPERIDKIPSGIYFAVVFAVQFLIVVISGNSGLNFGLYGLLGFDTFGILYFLSGLTGIFLWLRISKLIALIPGRSRLVILIGRSTKYIMAFHVFGYFVTNWIFNLCVSKGIGTDFFAGYSSEKWHGYLYYINSTNSRCVLIYLVVSMGICLLISAIIQTVKNMFKKVEA